MSLSSPFIKKPIATSLIMAAIVLAGAAAYPFLPVAPLPAVEFPTITVTGSYPGASPSTMATAVAEPLETQFGQIPGLAQMTSINVLGNSQITLQFDLSRNIDGAATDVLEAINAAGGQLPKDIPNPPTLRKTNPADAPILILAATSDTVPITDVDASAENIIAQQLSQVSGVSQVLVGGQQTPAVRVQVDPAKLAGLGLTLEDVRTVLTNATANAPKGTIDGPKQSYTVYANDQRETAEEYNNAIISYSGGGAVRIKDIGQAVTGPQNRELKAWQDNKDAVLLLVFKQPGANVISTVDAVRAKLPGFGECYVVDVAPAEKHIPGHQHQDRQRPYANHPRVRQGRRVHAGPVDRPRHQRDLRLSPQPLGHRHPKRDHPRGARRHARRHVHLRLQPR